LRHASEQLFLPLPHRRRLTSIIYRMIVAEHMQHAVDDEARQLLAYSDSAGRGVFARDVRADVDVTDNWTAATVSPQTKRDHVGWAMVPKESAVELGDCGAPNEGDR